MPADANDANAALPDGRTRDANAVVNILLLLLLLMMTMPVMLYSTVSVRTDAAPPASTRAAPRHSRLEPVTEPVPTSIIQCR